MFCVHCGSALADSTNFCPVCGRAQAEPRALLTANVEYAGFWMRFAASLIDGLVFVPLTLLGFGLIMTAVPGVFSPNVPPEKMVLLLVLCIAFSLVAVIGGWLYFTLMESSRYQATLGKKLLGLAVTTLDGERISFGRANGRYFGKMLSGMLMNVGYIMAAFTDKKQALHYMLASCLVVKR